MDYSELVNDVFELERKLFMKMDSYNLLEQKCNRKCLNQDERKQLFLDIHYVFKRLIRIIKNSCPSLTNEDVMFCCLKKSGLDNKMAGHCIGCSSRPAVNQRRYRIKKKMKEFGCDYLFDMIFIYDDL